jgi:MSHA biogenesis protein MshQ
LKRLSRLLLTLALLTLPGAALWAQTATVTATPGACANVTGIGSDNWNNPGNALTQNGTSATVSMNDGEISRYLRCTDYGFTIPTGVTISGITVTVRRSVDNAGGNPRDYAVQLLKAGVLQATNYADTGTTYPTALAFANYGGTGNLWGTTWTVADINNANFGVSFVSNKPGTTGGNRTVSVDVISVAVTYTDTTAPTVTSITRVDATPTNGISSASWTVTFSEPVTGVNAADFVLVQGGGMSGASIASVTGSGTTWTVTANLGVNTGTLGLNLVDDDSVQDSVGNRLGGTGTGNGNFTGEVYTVTAAPCNPPSNIPVGVTVACVCDNFNRTNLNPSPIFGQDWITSISDSTGIQPSIVNSNYLRLTNNTGNNAKAATVPSAFPAAGNYISVEFLHYAYNGSGADGIAVTLSDYNVPAVPGAYGGSLGYAQQTAINGFAGGWIGVALDEYGNYQNPTEGRLGGPGFLVDSVGVRGSGSGTTGYRWLQGTAANLAPGIDNAGSTARAPGYRYQIVVDARNAGATTPQTLVTVNRDTTGGGYAALIPQFDAFARAVTLGFTQAPVPANWQISFTGSTGGSTNIHEIGSLRICAQTVVPPSGGVASGFAVIDEAYGTPPIAVQNYLTGRIYTKVAGTPFKLNVAAINNNQVQTGYVLAGSRNVDVKLVDNSDGVCVLNSAQANYCSAACRAKTAVPGGTQTLNFTAANAGQKQSTDFTIPAAWSNLAAIVSDGTTTACSTDAFSVRPLNFNTLSSTASNAALTGPPALRAGTDTFGMTVGTATTGYAGAAAVPTINPAGVTANAAGWTVGSINPGSFPAAVSSSSTRSDFTYSEVGHFRFLGYDPTTNTTSARGIYDSTWTAIDQGTQFDCIANSYANTRDTSGSFASNANYGKYGCNFGITSDSALFGRFYPDRFTVTTSGVTPSCPSTTVNSVTNRPHTYMGQARLGIAYRIEARNGFNSLTQNYATTLFGAGVLPVPALVAEDQATANQGCNLVSRIGGAPTANWVAGVYNATTSSAAFSRPTTATPGTLNASTPVLCTASRANAGNPFWELDLGVQVVDGNAVMALADMNADSTGVCSGATCNAKKLSPTSTGIVLGRLSLLNAYGSDTVALQVPVRAEFWNGNGWQLNTDDRCTTLTSTNLAAGNVVQAAGSGLSVNNASMTLNPSATLNNGMTNFRINPATRGAGSVDLVLNLGFGTDANVDWCGNWNAGSPIAGTGTAPSPDLSFFAAQWCGNNADRAPAARAQFGVPRAPYIYLRERY